MGVTDDKRCMLMLKERSNCQFASDCVSIANSIVTVAQIVQVESPADS